METEAKCPIVFLYFGGCCMYNEISVRTNMLRSIEFRSKFVKQIQNLPEETQEGLKKVAIRFVNDENDDKCLDILWRMTYDPETALNMLGISIENDAILDDEAEKNIQIPYVLTKNFRNELRAQRKKVHPEFMEIHIPDGCKEAFENFLKASADPILATATCNHCNKVYGDFTDEEISRIMFLLESPTEANFFGGIRSLKFGYAQTVCLKKYAYHIHDYLEGLRYEEKSVVLLVKKIVRNYCGNDSVKTSRLVAQIRAELNANENWNTK